MKSLFAFSPRLQELLAATRGRVLRHGLLLALSLGLPAWVLAAWVAGGSQRLEGFIAWGLSLSLLGLVVVLVRAFILQPVGRLDSPRALARIVEGRGNFANLLVAAEEAGRLPERWDQSDPVHAELLRRLQERACGILDLLIPDHIVTLRYRRSATAGLVAGLVLLAVLTATDPAGMGRGALRLLRPDVRQVVPHLGGIHAEQGPGFVVAGSSARLTARDFGRQGGPAVCEIRSGSGTWREVPAEPVPVFADRAGMGPAFARWQAEIPDVREDFEWRFRRGERLSRPRTVLVRHHPLVTALKGRVVPPLYTGTAVQDIPVLPSFLEVPAGSTLEILGKINQPVATASLVTGQGDSLALDPGSPETGGLDFRGRVAVDEPLRFHIALVDGFGLANTAPLDYQIATIADAAPVVNLERPQDDGLLPLAGEISLVVEAADDFGLAGLELKVRPVTGAAWGEGDDLHPDEGWSGGLVWSPQGDSPQAWTSSVGPWRVRLLPGQEVIGRVRIRAELAVEAGRLDLMAGDALEIVAEARDNKEPGPANMSRSRILRLVLPSAAEVLSEQAQANEDRRSELQEARRRSQSLGADLDRLTRELLKNPVPDWARQQEMEAAIQRQKALQEELTRVAEELRRELDSLAQSQLTNPEQMEKADEVSRLLDQQQSGFLEDLLRRMETGADRLTPEEVARAIQEVARNQKELARKMDAALSMLDRMAQEQELDGLTSLLEKLMEKQQELAEMSRRLAEEQQAEEQQDGADSPEGDAPDGGQEDQEGASPEDQSGDADAEQQASQEPGDQEQGDQEPSAQELAERQEALNQELAELQKQLEEALEALRSDQDKQDRSPASEMMQQTLSEALEKMKEQQSAEKMKEAMEQLQQMNPDQAAQMQEQALRDMGSLYHVLLQSQEAMQMAMQQKQVTSLRGLAADMLALSARQEEIATRIPTRLREVRSLDLTRSQHRLQKALVIVREELAELTDESPMRILALLNKLDDLVEVMGYGVNALEENRGTAARRHSRESLGQANNIVIGLLTEAQMSSQGGGGGNPQPSQAEQLMQMIKEQAGLNGMTEQLRKMLADRGISQEARSKMKRLGEAQGDLARGVEELAEEERVRPEGERMLGDLAELGRSMESVSGDIESGLVSEETLIRQERILSRMLDARNSVRQRDFSTRRESRTAARLYTDQEGELRPGDEEASRRFLLKYQPLDSAPLEYRDLVRRYFTALDSLGRLDQGDLLPEPEPAPEGDVP